MFATDADLLELEPTLFVRLAWPSQRLLQTAGELVSGVLEIDGAGRSFADAGVGPGSVVVHGRTAFEVLGLDGPHRAIVSHPRGGGDAIPPEDAGEQPVRAVSFVPQIALAHRQAMSMLGLDPDLVQGADAMVLTPGPVRRVEALGAMVLIYAAASAAGDADAALAERAGLYRRLFSEARRAARVTLDLDLDGGPDATRRFGAVSLRRV